MSDSHSHDLPYTINSVTNSGYLSPADRILNYGVFICATLLLVAYFLPYVILGSNSYITIHDNLDGEFVYKYMLATSGHGFDGTGAIIPNIMDGIPRSLFYSPFDITFLMFYCFKPYTAYIVNHILVHLIAFVGMFLLLRRHFLKSAIYNNIVILVSLCFSIIPFYSQYGISVAGQPLLLFAFLNFQKKKHSIYDYVIICIFPFYSYLVLAGPFIISYLFFLSVLYYIKERRFNYHFIGGLVLMIVLYCIKEHQMLTSLFLNKPFISQRTEWNKWHDLSIGTCIGRFKEMLLHNQYHSGIFPTYIILIAFATAVITDGRKLIQDGTFLILCLSILFICTFYGFYSWFDILCEQIMPNMKSANLSRFTFLLPSLWMLLLAICLKEISAKSLLKPFAYMLVISQIWLTLMSNTEFRNNIALVRGKSITQPTFSQFFDERLFLRVKDFIGQPRYSFKVVSLGLYPSISLFNGFYTSDAYLSTYDVTYKHRFRECIKYELEKNRALQDYFDNWGNRCYLFADELGTEYLYGKNKNKVINELKLDTAALKSIGCKYIVSAVRIKNCDDIGLKYENMFFDDSSFWRIFLYRIDDKLET
jgi:hypothetical protein